MIVGCRAAAGDRGRLEHFRGDYHMSILSVLGRSTHLGQWLRVLERSGAGSCGHQGGAVDVIFEEIKGIFLFWSPVSEGW